ncbi:MAG: thioredoxin [Defluviitaleaceae bacterium]|nr:thioredoxin [Defluviitaleaceae bacterium]
MKKIFYKLVRVVTLPAPIQIFLFAAGVILIALGVLRGEIAEIFEKGAVVCMQCIGLG